MPRTSSHLIPTSDNQPYSKSEKTKKPFIPSSHSSRPPLPFIVFSIVCLLVGISGTIFSLLTFTRSQSPPIFRCGRVQDSFRGHYLSTVQNRRSSKISDGGNSIDRPKFLGLVGILTGFDSFDRREALRSTWFPSDPEGLLRLEHSTGLAFRFVIGRSKDAKKMAALSQEVDKYKDFLRIDVDEEHASPPYKTLAFFIAAFEFFEADYYVRAGDDIYLRPVSPFNVKMKVMKTALADLDLPRLQDRLATLLAKERTEARTYIGCMKKGPVITDPKMKWYESQGHLIGNEYFLHAYAPLYILSAEVVSSLASSKNNSLRIFSNEDVTIGSWMLAMNIHHEDNRAMCDPRCTPTSIGVWDIPKCSGLCNPAARLKELHDTNMCAKSPTLPPEEDDDR